MKNKKYLLGLDIGSSSVKAALVEVESGKAVSSSQSPDSELPINSPHPGWAEQDPHMWWKHTCLAINKIQAEDSWKNNIEGIGISYQMHGLVLLDNNNEVLRPSIIWCDSRAVDIGEEAFEGIGKDQTLTELLNSPGNFTASKLAWVKQNEPELYNKAAKFLLPGDYIAFKLCGETVTTASGLSEGIFWDFKNHKVSESIIDYFGFNRDLVPDLMPTFGSQGVTNSACFKETGISEGTKISYRAGDQPNNALSLNVFNPGELAATAGTSGVVYGILDQLNHDRQSRVNLFAHVNHEQEQKRLGVLLCVNGTGILYSWLKNQLFAGEINYSEMNSLGSFVPPGSDGLRIYPFGNGVERILQNKPFGGQFRGLDFNRHTRAHIIRAAQEGIIFAMKYGLEAMQELGVKTKKVRAGYANMFQSELFCELFASITHTTIELYNTDGAIGAARGAGIGSGIYNGPNEAFKSLKAVKTIYPNKRLSGIYDEIYKGWKSELEQK